MTTKLDELVGYLAGRETDPRLLEELADPGSDANLFLEAARRKSRALFEEPTRSFTSPGVNPAKPGVGWFAWALLVVVASIGPAFTYRMIDARLRQIEVNQRSLEAEGQRTSSRVESSLDRLREVPSDPALLRLETSLARLERRLQTPERPAEPVKPDPIPAQLRDELANLRFEVSAAEKTKARQFEELQASVHEVGRLLKLLINRLDSPTPPNSPEPPRTFPPPRTSGTGALK